MHLELSICLQGKIVDIAGVVEQALKLLLPEAGEIKGVRILSH